TRNQVVASRGECNRVDRRCVDDCAKKLSTGKRVDLYRVAPSDRGAVPGGRDRWKRRGVVPVNGGHAWQVCEQVATRGIPDAGSVVPAADRDEPLIRDEAFRCIALRADRRRSPAVIRRSRVPNPSGTVPRGADDATRFRIKVSGEDDTV